MKKLKLEDLKIQSFVTTLKNEDDLMGAGANSESIIPAHCDDDSNGNCYSEMVCADTEEVDLCDALSDGDACDLSEDVEECVPDEDEEQTEFPECPEPDDERYPA